MKDNVKGVGIGIIVLGVIGYLMVMANIAMMAMGAMGGNQQWISEFEREFGAEAARAIAYGSQWVGIILNVIGSAALIFGGLQMMRRRSWGLCVATCFLAMVPCWGCCCLGIPLGAFGLYLLFNDEVKQSFNAAA
jgi:hypothetical protein